MTEVSFYHLLHTPLERALPRLLAKVCESGARAVVRTGSGERAEYLCGLLWTFDPASFLPHGTAQDGNAADQPIWLTPDDDNPNGADILVLIDGERSQRLADYTRCLDMFDGRNDAAVAAARERWTAYKADGHTLTYWQQTERGGWEQRAQSGA